MLLLLWIIVTQAVADNICADQYHSTIDQRLPGTLCFTCLSTFGTFEECYASDGEVLSYMFPNYESITMDIWFIRDVCSLYGFKCTITNRNFAVASARYYDRIICKYRYCETWWYSGIYHLCAVRRYEKGWSGLIFENE